MCSANSWTRTPGGERSLSEPFRDGDGSTNSWTRALGSVRSRSEPFEPWWNGSASSWTRALGSARSRSELFGIGNGSGRTRLGCVSMTLVFYCSSKELV